MRKFTGAITAIVTPFNKDGSLDLNSLERLVEFQISSGIDGIVPCGSTGEAATLTIEEYQQVLETVVRVTNKRIPVIAGAGSNDTQKAINFSQIAKKAGVDGLLHVTPFYNKPTANGIVAHFKAIADASKLPIVLYNVPGRTGSNIPASLTLRVAKEVPLVIGVKEASGNISQIMEILQKRSPNFSVLSGDDAVTLPLMALGADGCISVVANESPKQFADLVHCAANGDWNKARILHYQLLDLMNINFIESNPVPVKTALSLMGKMSETIRLPLVTLEPENQKSLIKVLKEAKLI